MDKTTIDILKILTQQEEYITATILGEKMNINEKTVRRKITQLNSSFGDNPLIISKKGVGFKIVDQTKYSDILKTLNSVVELNYSCDRQLLIFEKLVDSTEAVSKDEFLDFLYVSEGTFASDLKKLRLVCENCKVVVNYSPSKGYYLIGEEYNIRYVLLSLHRNSYLLEPRKNAGNGIFSEVELIVWESLINKGLNSSKHVVDTITNYLLISLRNIKKGREIKDGFDSELEIEYNKVAQNIHYRFSLNFEVEFSISETHFLSVFINKVITNDFNEGNNLRKETINVESNIKKIILDELITHIGLKIPEYFIFDEQLNDFVRKFQNRLENNTLFEGALKKNHWNNHTAAFLVSKIVFQRLKNELQITVHNDEIKYFSLFLSYFLLNRDFQQKRKALTILPEDFLISRLFISSLKIGFPMDVTFISLQDFIKSDDLTNFPLIINSNKNTFKNIYNNEVLVSEVLQKSDLSRLIFLSKLNSVDSLVRLLKKTVVEVAQDNDHDTYIRGTTIGKTTFYFEKFPTDASLIATLVKKKNERRYIIKINNQLQSEDIEDLLFFIMELIRKNKDMDFEEEYFFLNELNLYILGEDQS